MDEVNSMEAIRDSHIIYNRVVFNRGYREDYINNDYIPWNTSGFILRI